MDDTTTNECRKTHCQWGSACLESCKGCDCYYDPTTLIDGQRDDRLEYMNDYFRMMDEEQD